MRRGPAHQGPREKKERKRKGHEYLELIVCSAQSPLLLGSHNNICLSALRLYNVELETTRLPPVFTKLVPTMDKMNICKLIRRKNKKKSTRLWARQTFIQPKR
jgi:hypothetical protein